MERFTVFDVETPNSRNDSICQIGVIHHQAGQLKLIDRLVNPECEFSWHNTRIHGIEFDDVRQEPTFLPVWQEIRDYFLDHVVIGHNVTFDLAVLNKTLHRYGEPLIEVEYLDTMSLMKSLGLKSSLDFSCAYFGIELARHHNALADAKATHDLFTVLKQEIPLYREFIRSYAFDPVSRRMRKTDPARDPLPPTDGRALREILAGAGILQPEGRPELMGQKVCLSGNFRKGKKQEVRAAIEARGGQVFQTVTRKIDCLIVGSIPDPNWSNGSYGTKVKKAMEMATKGHPIRIIPEEDVF